MGIEIAVMGFALLSVTLGIVMPVVGWATWVDVGERRIVQTMRARLLEAAPAPEARDGTRAAVTIELADRHVVVSARERGRTPIWRFEFPHVAVRSSTTRTVVVDKTWATSVRDLGPATFRDIAGLDGYRMARALPRAASAPDVETSRHVPVDAPLQRAFEDDERLVRALSPVTHGQRLLELVVDERSFTFDMARDGLDADDVWVLLLRCLHVIGVLDEGQGTPRLPSIALKTRDDRLLPGRRS